MSALGQKRHPANGLGYLLRADFGTHGVTIIVPATASGFSGNVKTNANMVLTGMNWRF